MKWMNAIWLGFLNFLLWLIVGIYLQTPYRCKSRSSIEFWRPSLRSNEISKSYQSSFPRSLIHQNQNIYTFSNDFLQDYRNDKLIKLKLPEFSTIVGDEMCQRIVHHVVSKKHVCGAVVKVTNSYSSYDLFRYAGDKNSSYLHKFFPVPQESTRSVQSKKLYSLLSDLQEVEKDLKDIFRSHGLKSGVDVVLFVVNDGEIDLLDNWFASCFHHQIDLVEIPIVIISATPPLTALQYAPNHTILYSHSSLGKVSHKASQQYLDRTFVDMMWFKSLAVWLLLKLKYSVLFQDVDIVWFRNPLPYLRQRLVSMSSPPPSTSFSSSTSTFTSTSTTSSRNLGFFSDDGQRGSRFAPFYANSGFFYLPYSLEALDFAWRIVLSLESIEISGSHQNIFNDKLNEAVARTGVTPVILNDRLFSNGAKFHHDQAFMLGILHHHEHPYVFHMCWTAGKMDKIKYFKQAGMWYL